MENRLERILKMLETEPESSFLLFALAKEYEKEGEQNLTIETFEKLRTLDPNYVGLYYHLAFAYHEVNPEMALKIYEAGIQIAQNQNDLHALSELKNAKMNFELEL